MRRYFFVLLVFVFSSCSKETSVRDADNSQLAADFATLVWEEYDNKNYRAMEAYCGIGAYLGNASCEAWMGLWAQNGGDDKGSFFWYERSASHGEARSLYALGDLYHRYGNYERARECYEAEVAAGDNFEDVIARLEEIPSKKDYPALYRYAFSGALEFSVDDHRYRPVAFDAALMYALKAGFTEPEQREKLLDPLGLFIAVEIPREGNYDAIALKLADFAFDDIDSVTKFRLFMKRDLIDTYHEYAKKRDAVAQYIVKQMDEQEIHVPSHDDVFSDLPVMDRNFVLKNTASSLEASEYEKVLYILESHAADGNAEACSMLGLIYEQGLGVEKDGTKASFYKNKGK